MALDWMQFERWEPLDDGKEMDEGEISSSQGAPNVNNGENTVDEALMASKLDMKKEEEIKNAKTMELQKWKDFDVYEEVEDEGQKAISVHWVFTEGDGLRVHLVVRGL